VGGRTACAFKDAWTKTSKPARARKRAKYWMRLLIEEGTSETILSATSNTLTDLSSEWLYKSGLSVPAECGTPEAHHISFTTLTVVAMPTSHQQLEKGSLSYVKAEKLD
jgi:hypothetical protein